MPTSSEYSARFRRMECNTYALQTQPELAALLYFAGYHWIRRIPQDYAAVLRSPTIGCRIEMYAMPYPGTVHIDSQEGKRLVKRLCYF